MHVCGWIRIVPVCRGGMRVTRVNMWVTGRKRSSHHLKNQAELLELQYKYIKMEH